MYLIDTNVISAGAPTKAQVVLGLVAWMVENTSRLYLSVITVAEIEDGIAQARRREAILKADRLAAWLETVLHLYTARILPVDVAVARRLGALSDQARAAGLAPGLADLAIAATAASRGFTLLTSNVRHFRALSVLSHDPFELAFRGCVVVLNGQGALQLITETRSVLQPAHGRREPRADRH